MAKIRYKPNPLFEGQYAHDPKLGQLLRRQVNAASRHAEGISPVMFGAYRRSHTVSEASVENDHLTMAYGNTDTDSNLVEFGGGGTPAYHVLARAAESAQFEFRGE